MRRFYKIVCGGAVVSAVILGASCGGGPGNAQEGIAPLDEPVGTVPQVSVAPPVELENPEGATPQEQLAATDWTRALVDKARAQLGGASIGDSCDTIPVIPLPDPIDMFTVAVGVARDYDDGTCRIIAWGVQAAIPGAPVEQQLPERAIADVEEFSREYQAPLLLLDDNGNYLGSNIGALADPPR